MIEKIIDIKIYRKIKYSLLYQLMVLLFLSCLSCESKGQKKNSTSNFTVSNLAIDQEYKIPEGKVSELKTFLKGSKYNQNLAVFIDFKIPSNKYRFFIYDLKTDKILEKGLVAHGSGSVVEGSSDLTFSNVENSYQSSLGKFEIANTYVGNFGKSYRLKGLDKTNDLAMKRAIVLHPYSCIGDAEQEELSCLSLGCPMISQNFMDTAAKYFDESKAPMIMYCYY